MIRGKRRGRALIMVMLVVAGITTIVFATQRIALVQFSQSIREEDNLVATYAAQAGIEDGLARYHFERNTETADDNVFRFNLTKAAYPNTENHEIEATTGIEEGITGNDYDPTHQYYDLAMSYRTQRINIAENGDLAFPADGTSRIERDETLLLTGFPEASEDYYLRYAFRFIEEDLEECIDPSQAFVTLQQVDVSTGGAETAHQVLARNSGGVYDSHETATNLQIRYGGDSIISSIRIRAYYCPVQFAFATTRQNDGLGSSNGDDFGPEFDSLTTDILSTGYYGSAKRTLIARVDRQTGNLLGIFDYLLYAGGGGTGNTGNIDRL